MHELECPVTVLHPEKYETDEGWVTETWCGGCGAIVSRTVR